MTMHAGSEFEQVLLEISSAKTTPPQATGSTVVRGGMAVSVQDGRRPAAVEQDQRRRRPPTTDIAVTNAANPAPGTGVGEIPATWKRIVAVLVTAEKLNS